MDVYATYQPEKYVDTRIVYTSTSSLLADDAGRVAIDYFKVHFVETCYDLDIAVTAGINSEYIYDIHSNTDPLDIEATYSFTNDATCGYTRTARIKTEGSPDSDYVAIPSGTFPFIALHSTYGVRINHQRTGNEYDVPERFTIEIMVENSATYSTHA